MDTWTRINLNDAEALHYVIVALVVVFRLVHCVVLPNQCKHRKDKKFSRSRHWE